RRAQEGVRRGAMGRRAYLPTGSSTETGGPALYISRTRERTANAIDAGRFPRRGVGNSPAPGGRRLRRSVYSVSLSLAMVAGSDPCRSRKGSIVVRFAYNAERPPPPPNTGIAAWLRPGTPGRVEAPPSATGPKPP